MISFDLKYNLAMRNMSIKELAKHTEMSPTTLSLLANGKSKGIQFNTLEKICTALDVTPNDLFKIFPDEYTITTSLKTYKINDFTYFIIDLMTTETAIELRKQERALGPEYFYGLVLGFKAEKISGNSYQLIVRAGLPWNMTEKEKEIYDNPVSENYNSLEDTKDLLQSLSNIQLENLSKNMGEFILHRLFKDSKLSFNQVTIFFKIDTDDTAYIPTFSFRTEKKKHKINLYR